MIIYIILVLLFPVTSFTENTSDASLSLIYELKEDAGWSLKSYDGRELAIYQKSIDGLNRNAIRISGIYTINPESIIKVVEDIDNYKTFISANNISCEIVDRSDSLIIGYQHIAARFIKDRHLMFRMFRTAADESETGLSWEIVYPEDSLKFFIDGKNQELNNPRYIDHGAGTWTFETMNDGRTLVSYSLYMDPGGWIPGFLIERINTSGIVQIFNDVIREAKRREEVTQ